MPRPKGSKNKTENNNFTSEIKNPIDNQFLKNMNTLNEAQKQTNSSQEFIISPDGLYKFPKPQSHGFDLELGGLNIDYFERPGYQIAWFKDEKPHELAQAVKMGYEFVDPNCQEAEGRELKKHGGYRENGSAYHLYAMQIPIELFKKRKEAEQGNLKTHEEQQGIYATSEMKLGTGYQHGYLKK